MFFASVLVTGRAGSQPDVPSEQQAIVQSKNGGPEVLSLQTVPVLKPGSDQVLIRVRAAAINPIDWKIREGYAPFPTHEPRIPGFDVAGDIVRTGADVSGLEVGDAVFAMIGMLKTDGLNGGYAEYALAPAANTRLKPDGFNYAEAAGLGTVGIAAARLLHRADIETGERVFVNGIAGGVGSTVAQMARAKGAIVIGTASSRHHDYLRSLGVAEIIDYSSASFVDVVDPVDVYVETVNKDLAAEGLGIVKSGGRLVSVVGAPDEDLCNEAGVSCTAIGGPPGPDELTEAEYLQRVGELAARGKLRINVDREMPLVEAAEAQELNRKGHTQGKLILVIDSDGA